MKQIYQILSSSKLTILLLLLFAVSCAVGTFVENDFGTKATWAVIYNAWWFELIMFLLILNFSFLMRKFKMFQKSKLTVFLFHLGFVIVLIGAFVSRYTGFEGYVHIREGESVDFMLSKELYVYLIENEDTLTEKINPTCLTPGNIQLDLNQNRLSQLNFVERGVQGVDEGEQTILEIVTVLDGARSTFFLEENQFVRIEDATLGFNTKVDCDISIEKKESEYFVKPNKDGEFMEMATQSKFPIRKDEEQSLKKRSLYQIGSISFVIAKIHENSCLTYVSNPDKKSQDSDYLELELTNEGEKHAFWIQVEEGEFHQQTVEIGSSEIEILIGPKKVPLGFELYLKDFELKRYPGSRSPSEFSSYLKVIDDSGSFDYTIFMNNVLDHKGFRFFQANYDTDEKGTILSVNHDWWGTMITYLGYFILFSGMILSLFLKKSRFRFLLNQLNKPRNLVLVPLLVFGNTWGQNSDDLVQKAGVYSVEITNEFGEVCVQDMDGRVKPMNTLALEMIRKITGKTKFNFQYGDEKVVLTANQLFVALHSKPEFWAFAPLIKLDLDDGKTVFQTLEIDPIEFLSLRTFFDDEGQYKIQSEVELAYKLKPGDRSVFDNELLKIDERINILYQALTDSYLKIFPRPNDINASWYSDKSVVLGMTTEDSVFVKNILPQIFSMLSSSNFNQTEVEEYIGYIKKFQRRYGNEIMPSKEQIEMEIWYNKANLFLHLFYSYWIIGFILLLIAIFQLFWKSKIWKWIRIVWISFSFLLLLVQTSNMILRWYIAEFPPWSNGYEMIILVAWFTVFFGLLFSRKSNFVLPLANLFAGTLLFVAFLDWLNPEITNLVPVLKSYWLKIHVAIIVGSYAPLALSCLLSLTALWLSIGNRKDKTEMTHSYFEVTNLSEISMTIGLYMLTIGTFLGGIWANESWGRYWGWDSKETWALISILSYAIVVHLRLIPTIRKIDLVFNIASIWAFLSIIMTSYGVNYYLSGLHSYAQGDPVPIPSWVYYFLAFWILTSFFALQRLKKA